jgi:hypothetical protein
MTLDDAITRALGGDTRELYALLARGSGLPGTRVNLPLAKAFAGLCATGSRGPQLALRMASLSGDEAPGGTALEILPLSGVLAAGACAVAQPKSREAMLAVIHDACDDVRYRVRDVVPLALAEIGARDGGALLRDLEPFLEGYFHAAAVLTALIEPTFLPRIEDADAIVHVLRKALDLANAAPRAAARYPGYKALVVAIEQAIVPLAIRFGEPVLAVVGGFRSEDPHLRATLERALADKKVRARFPEDHARALAGIRAQTKAPRDPRSAPRPTRKRGGGQRR